MSPAVRHRLYRRWSRLCVECREQPARFKYRGRVRADRDHTLCFRCFRAERDRQRAVRDFRSRDFRVKAEGASALAGGRTEVPTRAAA